MTQYLQEQNFFSWQNKWKYYITNVTIPEHLSLHWVYLQRYCAEKWSWKVTKTCEVYRKRVRQTVHFLKTSLQQVVLYQKWSESRVGQHEHLANDHSSWSLLILLTFSLGKKQTSQKVLQKSMPLSTYNAPRKAAEKSTPVRTIVYSPQPLNREICVNLFFSNSEGAFLACIT